MIIKPLVSICCITYNHRNYIQEAIEGFLMQKTSFPIEIIIHDDASTDGTTDIIREYERRYPDIIKPIYQSINQWSKGISPSLTFVWPKAKGKYIALCEGDDYWTDPLKLQKQVDFLERNEEYTICTGDYIPKYEENSEELIFSKKNNKDFFRTKGFSFTLEEMKTKWLTKTLTVLFRKESFDYIDFSKYKYFRDTHIYYHLLKKGKGFYINEIFGVYRIHPGGICSMKQGKINQNISYNIYKELYNNNRDQFSRVKLFNATLSLFNYDFYYAYEGNTLKKRVRLFFEAFFLIRNIKDIEKFFKSFIKRELKQKIKSRSR